MMRVPNLEFHLSRLARSQDLSTALEMTVFLAGGTRFGA